MTDNAKMVIGLLVVGMFFALIISPMLMILMGGVLGLVLAFGGFGQQQPEQEEEQVDVDELFRQWRRDKDDIENNRRR